MRLELSRFIKGDLDNIADYIAQDNPRRAVSFVQEIRARFHEIRHNPLLYELRPDGCAPSRRRMPAQPITPVRGLIKIETDRAEGAERVTRQGAGERWIGIVGFIGEIFDVDRNFQLLYPVRDHRIVNHV
jgi:plasmid stabilization system protein ParE